MSETATQHPKGTYRIFTLQMLGMIGFSMIFSLCVLYCSHRLGLSDHASYAITAAFNALAFATSVPAGYIAEKYLGYRLGLIISIIISATGLFILMIPNITLLYVGLGFFLVGTGMSLPCLYVLLGNLYSSYNQNRENGFLLSYIGMNVGSFIASGLSGTLVSLSGYSLPFLLGAIATLLMLPIYYANRLIFKESLNHYTSQSKIIGLLLTLCSIVITIFLVKFASIANSISLILGFVSIIYATRLGFKYSNSQRNKIFVFISLTVVSIIFWTLYSLSPSVLTIFIDRNVDHHLFGINIPTADFSSLNPFFIITLGPLMGLLLKQAEKKSGLTLSTPLKFAFGTILMGLGYFILPVGIHFHHIMGFISMAWIVISYFLQTAGELFIGPVGYAMVGELVPKETEGVMMGIWQLSLGIAGALSDFLSNLVTVHAHNAKPIATNLAYAHAFSWYGVITIMTGLITLLFARKIQHIIQDKSKHTTVFNQTLFNQPVTDQ